MTVSVSRTFSDLCSEETLLNLFYNLTVPRCMHMYIRVFSTGFYINPTFCISEGALRFAVIKEENYTILMFWNAS